MATWWNVARGPVTALALVTAMAGCSPHSADESARHAEMRDQGADTALSAFLAGRLAQQHGDVAAAAEYFSRALQHDPDNTELLQRAFTLMVMEGRFAEAAPLADRVLAYDADAPIALLVAGIHAANEGRYAQSEAHFAAIPKKGFNAILSPLLAAWSRAGQGRTDAAMEMLAPLAAAPGMEGLHAFHAGLINDIADRAETAEGHYVTALAGNLSIRPIEAAGSFYQRSGKPERARELYQRYQAEHPETMLLDGTLLLSAGKDAQRAVPDARAGLAQALFDTATLMRQGNALDLGMIFGRLALAARPDFPLAQMSVGDILAAQKRYAAANAVYAAIPKNTPARNYGQLRIAMNLDAMGDTEGALKALAVLSAEGSLDALVTRGDLLRSHKRYAEAASVYDEAVTRIGTPEERHWLLFFSRGIAYERSSQWPKAEADFLKALSLRPEQPDVLNYLGYSWVDQGINLTKGREMIEKAVSLRPKDGAIVDSLGWALYRMGDFQGAVKQLERAVELRPEDPTINDHLGDAYWQVGRVAEAGFQWRRALNLDPEPDQKAALETKIKTGEVPAQPLAK